MKLINVSAAFDPAKPMTPFYVSVDKILLIQEGPTGAVLYISGLATPLFTEHTVNSIISSFTPNKLN